MPRIRQYADRYAKEDFQTEIRQRQGQYNLMSVRSLAKASGMAATTLGVKWTGDLVGLMHNHRITFSQLAEKLGVTNRYVSMVLNSHRTPAGAETRFRAAVNELIAEQGNPDTTTS